MRLRAGLALGAALLASACVRDAPEGVPSAEPVYETASLLGLAAGPPIRTLEFSDRDAVEALHSFRESCPKLLARGDVSGITRTEDWRGACGMAVGWSDTSAREFFIHNFETVRVGDGSAFATGYFEPEITGSRERRPGYDVPIYKMPPELVRAWPDEIPENERTGPPPLGRYTADGRFVPFYERAEIEAGALANRGLEIAWAADPVEFFFLQIQGSGMLRLPDGQIMRIGYAGQNGREYVAIGSILRDRGLLGDEAGQYPASMQGIMQYIREHPKEGAELMRLNKSWIFFRELTTDGPLGALEVPVRRESSVAVDPNYIPLGAPVWLSLDRPIANGLWIAQDTGGAIKGANRVDTFWGNGSDARQLAGGMSARGQALVLVPRGTLAFHGLQ